MSALSDQGKRVWGLGRGSVWERFSAGASNQISLMKWVYGVHPDESEATASMPMLPKIALRGNFLLVIDHFISEITDCTQQQKTVPALFSASPGLGLFHK